MMWAAPAGVSGDWNVIRLSASLLDRAGDDYCTEFAALKVRPKVEPDNQERRYVPWEAFPLGVARAIRCGELPRLVRTIITSQNSQRTSD